MKIKYKSIPKFFILNTKDVAVISVFFAFYLECSAQSFVLKGRVVDGKGIGVEYANITFLHTADTSSTHTVTDSSGMFKAKVKKGIYELTVEHLGTLLLRKEFKLYEDADLGTLKVDLAVSLDEIIVQGRRPIIEQRTDRMIFNVENSIAAQGMSGLDDIGNAPLVMLDEQIGISIVGKSSLSVMVNNRQLPLSGSELMNYLRSIRSDDIARIEIITTPPSRFEAAGNSGIINIILKRNPNMGWSGNLTSSFMRNTKNATRNGLTLHYGGERINTSIRLRQYITGYKPEGTQDFLSSDQNILTKNLRDDTPSGVGANVSFDYKLDKKANIGLIYDFGRSNYSIKTFSESQYETLGVADSVLTTNGYQRRLTPTHTLNLYYDLQLDSTGKKLSIVTNYLNDEPGISDNFNTLNSVTSVHDLIRVNSLTTYMIYSGQSDLTIPMKIGTIETGLKYTLFDNSSDISYRELFGEEYVLNTSNSNLFDYKEQNFAGYFSMQGKFLDKWDYSAGLRYEYTTLRGETVDITDQAVESEYGKLFPTASLSYRKDNNNVFSANYSRRIGRPGFQSLNPFRWYSNPFTYTMGNPFLQPSFNDNFRLSYTYRSKLTVAAYNQYGSDYYTTIARLEDGIYSSIYENSYDQNQIGLSLGYYDTFFNRWEFSTNLNASHISAKGTIEEFESLNNSTLFYSLNNTVALDGNKNTNLLINFWHQLPSSTGNIYIEQRFALSAGLRASLFNRQLQVSAMLNDLFRSIRNDGERRYVGYTEIFTQFNDTRIFNLGLTYNFGNNKVRGANRRVRFDDRERTY